MIYGRITPARQAFLFRLKRASNGNGIGSWYWHDRKWKWEP